MVRTMFFFFFLRLVATTRIIDPLEMQTFHNNTFCVCVCECVLVGKTIFGERNDFYAESKKSFESHPSFVLFLDEFCCFVADYRKFTLLQQS